MWYSYKMRNTAYIVVLSLTACQGAGSSAIDPTTKTFETNPATGTTGPTTTTTSTTLTPAQCTVPPPDSSTRFSLDYPGEEFIFDDQGKFVTAIDWAGTVAAMSYAGEWTFTAPFDSNEIAGVDIDLDGNLIVADEGNGALVSVATNGSKSLILGSINSPNSLAVSDLGILYATAYDTLLKVDLDTGVPETIAEFPGNDLDGVAFSPDFRTLWFNQDDEGEVYRMTLDANGDASDLQHVLSLETIPGSIELDGMITDVCGNLYILRMDGRISRLRADGVEEIDYFKIDGASYTSAIHFGSGIDGWKTDHLYVMGRSGFLEEIDVGIDGAPEPHL